MRLQLLGASALLLALVPVAEAGKKKVGSRYVEIGDVTCREPIDEVSRELDTEVKAQYMAFSAGGKASFSQQVQRLDGLSPDQKVRERLEFKICMDYGNGLLTKEEYKLWSLLLNGDESAKQSLHQLALGEQRQLAREVPPPSSCAEPNMTVSRVLIDAGELLKGGSGGSARPADRDALAMLESATSGDNSAPLWASVARARLYAGEGSAKVADAADRAAAGCPTWGVPDNYRGSAFVLDKRLDDARSAFGSASRKSPDYAFAFYNLAAVDLAEGQVSSALSSLDRALVADASFGEAALLKGRVQVGTGDLAGGIDSLRRATDLLPDSATAWSKLGEALSSAGDPGAGQALCRARDLGADAVCPG